MAMAEDISTQFFEADSTKRRILTDSFQLAKAEKHWSPVSREDSLLLEAYQYQLDRASP